MRGSGHVAICEVLVTLQYNGSYPEPPEGARAAIAKIIWVTKEAMIL
jgi:hypothetical protein